MRLLASSCFFVFVFVLLIDVELNFALAHELIHNLWKVALFDRNPESLLENRDIDNFLNTAHVLLHDRFYGVLSLRSFAKFPRKGLDGTRARLNLRRPMVSTSNFSLIQ